MTNEEDLIQNHDETPNLNNSTMQDNIEKLLQNDNSHPPETKEINKTQNHETDSDDNDDILSNSLSSSNNSIISNNNTLNTIVPDFANPDEKVDESNAQNSSASIDDLNEIQSKNSDQNQNFAMKNQAPVPISDISLIKDQIESDLSNKVQEKSDIQNINNQSLTENNQLLNDHEQIPQNIQEDILQSDPEKISLNNQENQKFDDISTSKNSQEKISNSNPDSLQSIHDLNPINTNDKIQSILSTLQQKAMPATATEHDNESKPEHQDMQNDQELDSKIEESAQAMPQQTSYIEESENKSEKDQNNPKEETHSSLLTSQNPVQTTEYPKPVVPVIAINNAINSNQQKTNPIVKKSTTNNKPINNVRRFNAPANNRAKSSLNNAKRPTNTVTSRRRNGTNGQEDNKNKAPPKSHSVIRKRSASPSADTPQPMSSLCITAGDLKELLANDDEPELELNPQTTEALESFKKTGRLRFSLLEGPSDGEAGGTGGAFSPKIIRKLQRDKVNAILTGNYDDAKEADDLSKKFSNAVIESHEEDKRFERIRSAEWKLAEEKQEFSSFHQEWVEKVKAEEASLALRMKALEEVHESEMQQLEEKWNSEEFLRKFTKPSAGLLELKAVERSMVIAKMFDKAKQVRERAEQLQKIESKEQQKRATEEMKVERKRLRERQKRETQTLKEKCDQLLVIVKRNMQKEESPYRARIEKLEKQIADLKSGNDRKIIVPAMVQANAVSSPRVKGNELVTARTAFKLSAYKATAQSMKLNIKPLGCISKKGKKRSIVTKVEKQ